MEAASNRDVHITLLRAAFDVNVLILFGYLAFVALQLFFITRHAIADDIRNIGNKSSLVQRRVCMAFLSLLATWYYMFRYLFWSYNAYLERLKLTGGVLPTIPNCLGDWQCHERKAIAKLLRLSSWLKDLSLFEEAWLHVVRGKLNWWWSVEICLYTVGFWAIYVRSQGRAKIITYSWAYMVLGQTVAIGVAANLFNAAIAARESLPSKHVNEIDATIQDETQTDVTARTTKRSITRLSPPRYGELFFTLTAALAGLAVVSRVPSDLVSILIMHLGPMLIVMPILLPSAVVNRSLRPYLNLSTVYAIIAIVSLYIRVKTHLSIWTQMGRLPYIFLSHPAQSSISSDTICITITAIVELYEYHTREALKPLETGIFIVLTPILGPSVIMSASHALMQRRAENVQEEAIWRRADNDESLRGRDILETSVTTSTSYSASTTPQSSTQTKRGASKQSAS